MVPVDGFERITKANFNDISDFVLFVINVSGSFLIYCFLGVFYISYLFSLSDNLPYHFSVGDICVRTWSDSVRSRVNL